MAHEMLYLVRAFAAEARGLSSEVSKSNAFSRERKRIMTAIKVEALDMNERFEKRTDRDRN